MDRYGIALHYILLERRRCSYCSEQLEYLRNSHISSGGSNMYKTAVTHVELELWCCTAAQKYNIIQNASHNVPDKKLF
jgi:hypothetical protein